MVSLHGGGLKAPLLVWALAVAFLLLVASLLIGAFSKPDFPPYALGAHADSTYTLDASRGDEWRWWGDRGIRLCHRAPRGRVRADQLQRRHRKRRAGQVVRVQHVVAPAHVQASRLCDPHGRR